MVIWGNQLAHVCLPTNDPMGGLIKLERTATVRRRSASEVAERQSPGARVPEKQRRDGPTNILSIRCRCKAGATDGRPRASSLPVSRTVRLQSATRSRHHH